ncbi:MAG: AAA family ATPase [Bacteroidota bacterium]|nr:AAA family ATPase [Bacteroidota bacterium]
MELLYKSLLEKFAFEPTSKQEAFFRAITDFVNQNNSQNIFILKGYAGTGKTSVIATLVNCLDLINKDYVLLAPTGRASKVVANYSKKKSYTIHKKIFYTKIDQNGLSFKLQTNKHKNTIFIVDEASMISNSGYGNGTILENLIEYVYSAHGSKLILVGDTAQLPPIGTDLSPALDENEVELHFQLPVLSIELDQVMRQSQDSGILYNATLIRNKLHDYFLDDFTLTIGNYIDFKRLTEGDEIQDALHNAYYNNGIEETIFIVKSNKRANLYNQQIRNRILDRDSELSVGDLLMVVKNNYFWLKDNSQADFIANGDVVEVLEIFKIIELYGFKFAHIKTQLIDFPNISPFETIILLDTLHSEEASLTQEHQNKLYQEVLLDYQDEPTQYKRQKKVKENEYYNALQVKFAYAFTCHKAQGGQWDVVFVEQPYRTEPIDREYLRWLYTAITRAKQKVYLIGFKDEYFSQ